MTPYKNPCTQGPLRCRSSATLWDSTPALGPLRVAASEGPKDKGLVWLFVRHCKGSTLQRPDVWSCRFNCWWAGLLGFSNKRNYRSWVCGNDPACFDQDDATARAVGSGLYRLRMFIVPVPTALGKCTQLHRDNTYFHTILVLVA